MKVITALDRNNAPDVLKDRHMAKDFITRLVRKFKEPVLQERIKMRRRVWNKLKLCDIDFFKNEASSRAVDLPLTEATHQSVNPRNIRKQGKTSNVPNGTYSKDIQNRKEERKTVRFEDNCLNPECNGKHLLKDCPNTSPERNKELYDKFYKIKDTKKLKRVKSNPSSYPHSPNVDDGRFRVALEDTVFEVVLGDPSSDFNAIASATFSEVQKEHPSFNHLSWLVHFKTN